MSVAVAIDRDLFGAPSVDGGVDKGVMPAIYLDERTPPPRPTPDDWIVDHEGGPALATGWTLTGDADFDGQPVPLDDGEIVRFERLIDYGSAMLEAIQQCEDGEGTHEIIPTRDMPPGASNVMIAGEPDSLSDGVQEIISNIGWNPSDYPVELHYYDWRDEPPLRFDAVARKFVPATDAEIKAKRSKDRDAFAAAVTGATT